jgi:predicted Zn-dependent protease
LIYDYADALLSKGSAREALDFINRQLQFAPNDVRLYKLQAQSHEALGNILLQHKALAEVYSRQGDYPAAIEQLQIALKTDDGDFYQMSSVEARLRELRELAASQSKKK